MLAEEPLPRWASGRRVVAVGGQTRRPVDDVGLVTDEDGWVTIQAKKGLRVDRRPDGGLGEALRQLVEIDDVGVPDGATEALRPLEPGRDLVLILSDDSAASTVNGNLAPVVGRLRDLPADVPVSDAASTGLQSEALGVLGEQLGRCWKERWSRGITDADFRRLTSVLSVRALCIAEDGEDYATTVRSMLRDLAGEVTTAETLWQALLTEGQRLGEERAYLDRSGLVRALDAKGTALRPAARLRGDIGRLRALSTANVELLGKAVSVATPDGPVRLSRSVESALLGAVGNVAVTGGPGSGKSVLLYALAGAARATHDLVVLRSDDLRSSKAATRAELNLTHDLADVLTGWNGRKPGLVLIDGIDQARGTDAPDWLPGLADALSGTRWQIVVTVRSFDLKHSPLWKGMFPGVPVDAGAADSGLGGVRHLLVGDLTDEELAAARKASQHLADLLDAASPRLRELLANPFNLDLAGQLISEDSVGLLQVHTRAELLAEYWRRRVGEGPAAVGRTRALQALARQMITDRRQAVSTVNLPAEATPEALEDLHRNGVLRQASARPGRIDAPTSFAHPVLFDYAVAMLALGDLERPESLADVLDGNPNLAMTVRPSLEYRLGDVWSADGTRRGFWGLALRLASRTHGHLIAASEAARVAATQMNDAKDLALLAGAATGAVTDQTGRWGQNEARYLAYLLAAASGRSRRREAMACIDTLACDLARQARAADDTGLALTAAQLPVCAAGTQAADRRGPGYPWSTAAPVDCMTVALIDPADPARKMLADPAARLLALAAVTDPLAAAPTITAVINPGALHTWEMKVIRHLIPIIPAIAETVPDLAVAIGAAPWKYEETRDARTPMMGSAILELSTSLQQNVDTERFNVSNCFAKLMQAAPLAAATLLLDILRLPRMYYFTPEMNWREPPPVCQGNSLASAGGDRGLVTMADAFVQGLQDLAEADRAEQGSGHPDAVLGQIVRLLVSELALDEVWRCLLYRAATVPSPALARALLPALSTPTLYAHGETWNEAAHAAGRAAPLLVPGELASVQAAVRRIADASTTPGSSPLRRALEQRATLISAFLQDTESTGELPAASRPQETASAASLPPLQDVAEMPVWASRSSEGTVPGSFDDLALRARLQLQAPAETGQADDSDSSRALTALWDELDRLAAAEGADNSEVPDLAVEIAERLSACPDTEPDSALGTRIVTTVLSALPDPAILQATAETRNTDQSSWASSLTPGWGITAATRSAQALVRLHAREPWRAAFNGKIRKALALLLDAPDPLYRLIASDALPKLYGEPDALIDELERRLALEPDRHVATRLIDMLSSYVQRDPGRIDSVMQRLAASPRWAVLSSSPAGEQPVGPADQGSIGISIIAALGIVHDTPFAREVLDAWLTAPVDHPQRAMAAVHCLRLLINPAEPAARPIQERLLATIGKGFVQVRAAFADATQAGEVSAQEQARVSAAVKYADHLALLLYTESGAMDAKRQNPPPRPRGDLARFALLTMPLLEDLSAIHVPSVTQHVVQAADRIASASPKTALLIAARAVVGDESYWREMAGADAVLGFVRRFAAENRAVFLGDNEAIEAVRQLLESFIRLGWPQAIELAEELDELFG